MVIICFQLFLIVEECGSKNITGGFQMNGTSSTLLFSGGDHPDLVYYCLFNSTVATLCKSYI